MILLSLFSAAGCPSLIFSLLEITNIRYPAPSYANRLLAVLSSVTFLLYSVTRLLMNEELKQIIKNIVTIRKQNKVSAVVCTETTTMTYGNTILNQEFNWRTYYLSDSTMQMTPN